MVSRVASFIWIWHEHARQLECFCMCRLVCANFSFIYLYLLISHSVPHKKSSLKITSIRTMKILEYAVLITTMAIIITHMPYTKVYINALSVPTNNLAVTIVTSL